MRDLRLVASATDHGLTSQRLTDAQSGLDANKLHVSRVYTAARNLIGQMAGALLVSRLPIEKGMEHARLIAEDVLTKCGEVEDELAEISVREVSPKIVRAVTSALGRIKVCAGVLVASLPNRTRELVLDLAERRLRAAYREMARVADDRQGCAMVAFSTCCCCGGSSPSYG